MKGGGNFSFHLGVTMDEDTGRDSCGTDLKIETHKTLYVLGIPHLSVAQGREVGSRPNTTQVTFFLFFGEKASPDGPGVRRNEHES